MRMLIIDVQMTSNQPPGQITEKQWFPMAQKACEEAQAGKRGHPRIQGENGEQSEMTPALTHVLSVLDYRVEQDYGCLQG